MYTSFSDFFKAVQLDTSNLGFLNQKVTNYDHIGFQKRMKYYISMNMTGAFRAQKMGACYGKDGNLHYELNSEIALSSSYKELAEKVENINPGYHTRLGTRREYDLYCASLIQQLLEQGCEIEKAYHLVLDKPGTVTCRRSGYYLIGEGIWSDHLAVPHCVYADDNDQRIIVVQGAATYVGKGPKAAPWVVSEI